MLNPKKDALGGGTGEMLKFALSRANQLMRTVDISKKTCISISELNLNPCDNSKPVSAC